MRRAIPMLILMLSLAPLLVACHGSRPMSSATPPAAATLSLQTAQGEVSLSVEIAETQADRERGLMYRTSLPRDQGMAFLFPKTYTGGFWMKNTLIPLSIAFWDPNGRIIDILDMTPCESDSCPLYTPQGSGYIGAVEANQGFFEEHGVQIGDTVKLNR